MESARVVKIFDILEKLSTYFQATADLGNRTHAEMREQKIRIAALEGLTARLELGLAKSKKSKQAKKKPRKKVK